MWWGDEFRPAVESRTLDGDVRREPGVGNQGVGARETRETRAREPGMWARSENLGMGIGEVGPGELGEMNQRKGTSEWGPRSRGPRVLEPGSRCNEMHSCVCRTHLEMGLSFCSRFVLFPNQNVLGFCSSLKISESRRFVLLVTKPSSFTQEPIALLFPKWRKCTEGSLCVWRIFGWLPCYAVCLQSCHST